MTYLSDEQSVASGLPVELYDLTFNGLHWRYTSAAYEITYLTQVYLPVIIKREEVEITDDIFKNEVEINVARDNAFAVQFIPQPVGGVVTLTIYRGHEPNFITFWSGNLANITFNPDDIRMLFIPKTSSMLRIGIRRQYQKLCTHHLYGRLCAVNEDMFKIIGTIISITGRTIVASEFSAEIDGWFIGGKIVIGSDRRLITSHVGNTITVMSGMTNVSATDIFTAYAGCDHSTSICRTKFSNLINYGGQPWIPTKNPFSGDAIM